MSGHIATRPDAEHPEALQDYVARLLIQGISSGDLVAGQKLSPTKLAQEFGISHIPVREALSALEAAGQVKRVPRVGFFVADVSVDDIDDVYHWRQVLEDEAHRLAVPLLEKSDLDRMRKLNASAAKAVKSRINGRYIDLNRQLHFVVFEKAGSETLLRFLNNLWDSSQRYQNMMAYVGAPPTILRDQHEGIIEAFEARDATLANKRMAEHRAVTLAAIREMVLAGNAHPDS